MAAASQTLTISRLSLVLACASLASACAGVQRSPVLASPRLQLDAPRITRVDTDSRDGVYGPGRTIDIILTVSEPVHGNLVALLSSGGTVALSCEGKICAGRYLVREGEASRWLTVETFAGRLVDDDGNVFDNPAPPEYGNLAHLSAVTIGPEPEGHEPAVGVAQAPPERPTAPSRL